MSTADLGDLQVLIRTLDEATGRLGDSYGRIAELQRQVAEKDVQLARKTRFEELGRMASGLAHEIRNPLAAIQLYAAMLRRDMAGDPRKTEPLDRILAAVAGLDRLVEDMLLYGRDVAPARDDVSAEVLVEDALALARPEASIRVRRDVAVARVRVDPAMMRRALINLILNAAQAMPDGGELSVRVALADGRLRFLVADTGPGFAPNVLDRLGTPFLTSKAKGTGLGLALASKIAEAHGGALAARNRPGGGADVVLEVPA